MGLAVWVEDEAGPYQTVPYPGESWQAEGHPVQQPHEYIRNGTAKMLTLFQPATGEVRVKGVTQSTNAILHPWFKEQLSEILKKMPEKPILDPETNRKLWISWQEGLSRRITLSEQLPSLSYAVDLGQPSGISYAGNGVMVVCAWHNAFVHPCGRFLVEHG